MAEEITGDCVKLKGGKQIDTENVIWTAGNRPNQAIQDLGLPFDERTGIKVDLTLRVDGSERHLGHRGLRRRAGRAPGRRQGRAADRPGRHPGGPRGRPQRAQDHRR